MPTLREALEGMQGNSAVADRVGTRDAAGNTPARAYLNTLTELQDSPVLAIPELARMFNPNMDQNITVPNPAALGTSNHRFTVTHTPTASTITRNGTALTPQHFERMGAGLRLLHSLPPQTLQAMAPLLTQVHGGPAATPAQVTAFQNSLNGLTPVQLSTVSALALAPVEEVWRARSNDSNSIANIPNDVALFNLQQVIQNHQPVARQGHRNHANNQYANYHVNSPTDFTRALGGFTSLGADEHNPIRAAIDTAARAQNGNRLLLPQQRAISDILTAMEGQAPARTPPRERPAFLVELERQQNDAMRNLRAMHSLQSTALSSLTQQSRSALSGGYQQLNASMMGFNRTSNLLSSNSSQLYRQWLTTSQQIMQSSLNVNQQVANITLRAQATQATTMLRTQQQQQISELQDAINQQREFWRRATPEQLQQIQQNLDAINGIGRRSRMNVNPPAAGRRTSADIQNDGTELASLDLGGVGDALFNAGVTDGERPAPAHNSAAMVARLPVTDISERERPERANVSTNVNGGRDGDITPV